MGRRVDVGTSWTAVSTVACQYQLQAGERVLVATSVAAPSSSDDAIYVKQGDINYFEPVNSKTLWARAYYSSAPFGSIVVDEV